MIFYHHVIKFTNFRDSTDNNQLLRYQCNKNNIKLIKKTMVKIDSYLIM